MYIFRNYIYKFWRVVPNEATLKAMNHANQIMNGKIAEDGIVFSNANEAKAFLDNMS